MDTLQIAPGHHAFDANSSTPNVGARPRGVSGGVLVALRLEGAAACIAAAAVFTSSGQPWVLFAALFLVPDLSFAGYLGGPKFGAVVYNLAHSYAAAIALWLAGTYSEAPLAVSIALIWIAHIGFDRALGYGLKYGMSFNDTHLGPIGHARRSAT